MLRQVKIVSRTLHKAYWEIQTLYEKQVLVVCFTLHKPSSLGRPFVDYWPLTTTVYKP